MVVETLGVDRPAAVFLADLEWARYEGWVLEIDGTVRGWLSCAWVLDEMELHEVTVAPQLQGTGLGRQLMDHLYARARVHGIRTVHLEVRAGNPVARRLYERDGFGEVGRRRAYYQDGEDAVLYSLMLSDGED